MALIGQISKQPSERFPIEISFERRVVSGEDVVSADVSIVDEDGNDVSSSMVVSSSISSPVVTVNVQGGTDGTEYTLTVVATTNSALSAKHEADVKIIVEDT